MYPSYQPNDDNYEYLSKGVIGLVSAIQKFLTEYFDKELKTLRYDNDTFANIKVLNSEKFTNIFIQHFTDTEKGFIVFLDTIITSLKNILDDDINIIINYYIIAGAMILITLTPIIVTWIRKT
jgi:hypothetical protein